MLKLLHVGFALFSVVSLSGRVFFENQYPDFFAQKWMKLSHMIISALLLVTGFVLVFQGGWLSISYGWIVAKIVVLLAYIALGVLAVKNQGALRIQFYAGALICFLYIAAVAGTKNPFVFL